jgi:DNA-binding NarL/FixJ family response regulator
MKNESITQPAEVVLVTSEPVGGEALLRALYQVAPTVTMMTPEAAAQAVADGGVKAVVLLPRNVDASKVILALQRRRGTRLIIAAAGVTVTPPGCDEVQPFIAQNIEEVLEYLRKLNRRTTTLGLTDRHIDILQRLALGDTPTDAAEKLGITTKTLNNHLGVVYKRLTTRNITQAVLLAVRAGIVSL